MSTCPSPEHMDAVSEGLRRLRERELPVTLCAVIRRINRKLAHDGRRLRTTRGNRWRSSLRNYYVVDVERNAIVQTHVNVEKLGRELDVLYGWERLAADE